MFSQTPVEFIATCINSLLQDGYVSLILALSFSGIIFMLQIKGSISIEEHYQFLSIELEHAKLGDEYLESIQEFHKIG